MPAYVRRARSRLAWRHERPAVARRACSSPATARPTTRPTWSPTRRVDQPAGRRQARELVGYDRAASASAALGAARCRGPSDRRAPRRCSASTSWCATGLRESASGRCAGTAADVGADARSTDFGGWVAGDDAARIPGGEGVAAGRASGAGVLDAGRGRAPRRGAACRIVSHGGAIMTTVPVLLGAPRARRTTGRPGRRARRARGDDSGWRRSTAGETWWQHAR